MSEPTAYRLRPYKSKSKKVGGVRVMHGEVEDKIFVRVKGDLNQAQTDLIAEYFRDKLKKEVVLIPGNFDMVELERIE